MPKLSIITPLHNKGAYIAETICSVLDQTMSDWEMIIVENGSTDNGPEIIQQFIDSRIKLLVSPKCGPGAARNYGLNHASGEWLLFLDADDLIESSYLSNRLKTAQDNPLASIVAGCWEEFSNDLNARSLHRPSGSDNTISELENSAIAAAPWALHAAIIRRTHLTPELYWPEKMDEYPSEDTAFWFPLILGALVAYTNKSGALYRINTENSRNFIADMNRWVSGVIAVINKNVSVLSNKGMKPNELQIASIVRTLESNYRTSVCRGDMVSSKLSLKEANFWLMRCRCNSLSIRLRKILGLRLFNLLRFATI
jgi:glycosyltransferase involved in cell wall biosynthesis